MNQSINYFFQEVPGVASDNCKLYFDFLSGANLQTVYNKSGDPLLSGSIQSAVSSPFLSFQIPSFWVNGSGYFSQNLYVKIDNTTGINIQNFTTCFIYKNIKPGGSTLISTIDTGYSQSYTENGNLENNFIYKGFDFGITANNYLYFEYYTDNGPTIFIGEDNLSEKNSVFLSISNNNLSFGHYDFFKDKLISYDYNIDASYLHNANDIFIGYNPKATGTYAFNRVFSGFIDELLIFSPSIYNYEIESLNSGFVHIFNPGTYYQTVENLVTGVTGYGLGIIGYENQITGNGFIVTNELTGEFGEIYSGYTEVTLTGLVPLSGLIELTGVISFDVISGYNDVGVIKNNDYIQSFGKNYINFLYENTSEDFIELNFSTNYTTKVLRNLDFDYIPYSNRFTFKDDLNLNDNYSIFANGQLQQIGSFYLTGNGYSSGKYIINDYIIDNRSIYFGNKYNQDDSIVADYIVSYDTGLYLENFLVSTGTGTVSLPWGETTNLYFNGQKLTENFDYTVSLTLQANPAFYFSQKLTGDGKGQDRWGDSVATNNDGSIIVLGGRQDNASSGAAMIYMGSPALGWTYKQKLTGDDGDDLWGDSVAINGDGRVVVLGGYADNTFSGAAIIYTGSSAGGWVQKQKLTGDAGQDHWGRSVDINNDGSIIVLGGRQDNASSGAAIIYTGSAVGGWTYKQKLTGDFGDDAWGTSVATNYNGNVIVLGGPFDNSFSGGAVVYTGNAAVGWTYKQKLTGNNGADVWGFSVATNNDGSIIVLGGYGNNNSSGAAIIYTGSSAGGWAYKQELTGDRGADRWADSVAINGDGRVVILGSREDNNFSGGAIIYTGNATVGWTYKQKLTGNDGRVEPPDPRNTRVTTNNDGNVIILGRGHDNHFSGAATIYIAEKDIIFNQNSYKYTGISGKLIGINKLSDLTITGSGNLFNVNFYNFSEIYKNGVRQVLNSDYLELASIDSNTGKGFFDQKRDIIYNNI